jgi:predicted RNA methylase
MVHGGCCLQRALLLVIIGRVAAPDDQLSTPTSAVGGAGAGSLFVDEFGLKIPIRFRSMRKTAASQRISNWHFAMLNDIHRNQQYDRAIGRALSAAAPTPGRGAVVVDLGAGAGLLSALAAKHGARKVVSIEAEREFGIVADTIAQANGHSDVVERVRAISSEGRVRGQGPTAAEPATKFELDERADVLVFELVGNLLHSESALTYGPDARDRFLRPGGTVIPARGVQQAELVSSLGIRNRSWINGADLAGVGVDMSGMNAYANTVDTTTTYELGIDLHADPSYEPMSPPALLYEVHFATLPASGGEASTLKLGQKQSTVIVATKDGTVDAVLITWQMALDEAGEIVLTNHPRDPAWTSSRGRHWPALVQLVRVPRMMNVPSAPVPHASYHNVMLAIGGSPCCFDTLLVHHQVEDIHDPIRAPSETGGSVMLPRPLSVRRGERLRLSWVFNLMTVSGAPNQSVQRFVLEREEATIL